MQRDKVQSSNIAAIGYDRAQWTLEVEFKNGGVYRYDNVPPEEAERLRHASSIGTHFHHHIRGRFPYCRL
jgi:hypothetical protein